MTQLNTTFLKLNKIKQELQYLLVAIFNMKDHCCQYLVRVGFLIFFFFYDDNNAICLFVFFTRWVDRAIHMQIKTNTN